MPRKIHPIAGVTGFLLILTFWTSTILSELFGTYETIAAVKSMIVSGLWVLVPAMAIVGATGMSIGKNRKDAPALAKKNGCPSLPPTVC